MILKKHLILPSRIFIFLNIIFTGISGHALVHAGQIQAQVSYTAQSYIIGAGDILSLSVLPQSEYGATEILVRPDGNASFPGVGEIKVAEKTLDEINSELNIRLSKWLKKPRVVLTLAKPHALTVYLTGAVIKPGSLQIATYFYSNNYKIDSEMPVARTNSNLTNILVNAGGINLNADLSKVTIKQKSTGKEITVNLWQVLKEGNVEQDLWLSNNDSVSIPELPSNMSLSDADYLLLLRSNLAPKTFPIRVIGEAKQPSIVELDSQTPYLNSAIVKAGGYAPQAVKHVVAIRRFTSGNKFTTIYIDPRKQDFLMRPNDIVYIGENNIYKSGRYMQQAALVLSPFQTAALTGAGTVQTFGIGGWGRRFSLNKKQ